MIRLGTMLAGALLFLLAVQIWSGIATAENVADENFEVVLRALSGGGGAEAVNAGYDWRPVGSKKYPFLNAWENSGCSSETIRGYSQSVVRLLRPAPDKCQFPDGNPTEFEIDRLSTDINGCTAWRFAPTLFATAWHCLPEGDYSCRRATIGFDYLPKVSEIIATEPPPPGYSHRWESITERCTEIVYANRILDFVLFRVSTEKGPQWLDRPILPVPPGTTAFPQVDERIFILQHPAPGNPFKCNTPLTSALSAYNGYQMEQQISINSNRDRQCALAERPDAPGSIRWYSGINPYSPNVCDHRAINKYTGPATSVVHFCDTCEGSSGAPIFSLTGDRKCKVIGVHTSNGAETIHFSRSANVGTRLSVLGECIDFEASVAADAVVHRTDNARGRPECLADIPSGLDVVDCRKPEDFARTPICRDFLQD